MTRWRFIPPPSLTVLALCSATAYLLGTAPGCARDHGGQIPAQAISHESPAVPVKLLDLDGRPFDLWGSHSSPTTVVVFTRTDCPVSNRFAPEIRHLYEKYHPHGVEFFLVYVDPDETPDAIRTHLKAFGYPCQGLRDPEHSLVAACHATITPQAAVFDPRHQMTYLGRINDLYVDLGKARTVATTHELADAIDSTIAGRPVATRRARAVGCTISDLER